MNKKILAVGSVVISCIFWSISFSVSKILLRELTPYELAFIRFLLASIFAYLFFYKSIRRAEFNWDYQKPLFIAGLLGVTLYFIFENWGLKFTSASEGALLVGSFPALGLFIEILTEKKKFPFNRTLGVILSLLGVSLIVGNSGISFRLSNLFGDILILLSGLSWVLYNWQIKKVNHKYSYEVLTFFQMLYGTILFIPFLFFTGIRIPSTFSGLIGIFYLAFFCSALGYLLYNYGLKVLAVSQVVNILNLIPLFGAIWGVIFLKESLGIVQVFGGILIIIGVSITTWK